jgi:putative PIN family toxin of toxin-antitoxin system
LRAVLDANVVISGICFPDSVCGRIVYEAPATVQFLWSEVLRAEVFGVLARPKLDKFGPLPARLDAADRLISTGVQIALGEIGRRCRDPKDDHVLELAIVGQAALVVTGDRDLLILDPFGSIRVVSPASSMAMIHS